MHNSRLTRFDSPNHCLEEPRAIGDGRNGLVHQRVKLDEVQSFIRKLVGHFEFLSGGRSCADAGPEDDSSISIYCISDMTNTELTN